MQNTKHQIRQELRHLIRELGLLDRNCLGSQLNLTQAHLMTYLETNGATSFNELCSQLNADKAALSRSLQTLSNKGWIQVNPSTSDKRQKEVLLLPEGQATLQQANQSSDSIFSHVFSQLDNDQIQQVFTGLNLLNIGAIRRNLELGYKDVIFERLKPSYLQQAKIIANQAFAIEQGIPAELIELGDKHESIWWAARVGENLIGTAAIWKQQDGWHWGRFAVDTHLRGLGIGKQLAKHSLQDTFNNITQEIISEARDTTVAILSQFGADSLSEPVSFYGSPVTPVRLTKQQFLVSE
ncbi:helix-turn-helix domain-containing GNAT family N-acetyltransferase [Vibrio sonorensis]|uniref:helix-turn-helix domain-containing GNAT family N-acetyltransferase n=1 Tax=Vibrio sonorensis TaxID=1004316 RepID=UPI0008D942C8|nr:helix-turn-helix domain-containing GNAT family N-acetyltransferase [Vibrio sonorensis]